MIEAIQGYVWLIPALPCFNAAILGMGLLTVRQVIRTQRLVSASLSIGILFLVMVLSCVVLYAQLESRISYSELWTWIAVDTFSLQVGYFIDSLSCIMLVLVTSVALVVMVYTFGYMVHDQGYIRFFAYLSLFTSAMLGLIVSPNLLQVYIFWELVGMCSYLLVGFWFTRPSAAYACQKAFITNRIGDFGLLLGILGLYWLTGSLEFQVVGERIHRLILEEPTMHWAATFACVLVFLGPVAKSAQFPLHIWLPDAMEGPTPISALIHAATMVAAGVFLVARLLIVFQEIPLVMDLIASTGSITAILGASMALGQKDLKKGLAYSTMSQLGYMILALGLGSYQAGLFHLFTHAYSKALLFLGSGSVIHGIEPVLGYNPYYNQNMSYMGGLRKFMPVTAWTFLFGTLSISGIPPLACFWSKDAILSEAWEKWPFLGGIAWFTAGLTAFYMFRIYILTFEGLFRGHVGEKRLRLAKNNGHPFGQISYTKKGEGKKPALDCPMDPHESTFSMLLPLGVLSLPTLCLGWIGSPFSGNEVSSNLLANWLSFPSYDKFEWATSPWEDLVPTASLSLAIASFGISLAWFLYKPSDPRWRKFSGDNIDPKGYGWSQQLVTAVINWSTYRAYLDGFYDQSIVASTRRLANLLGKLDQWAIDGFINLGAMFTLFSGESLRYTESGQVQRYIYTITLSMVLFFFFSFYSTYF